MLGANDGIVSTASLVIAVAAARLAVVTAAASLLCLIGAIAARAGGSSAAVGPARVGFWVALAIAVTAGVGALAGTTT